MTNNQKKKPKIHYTNPNTIESKLPIQYAERILQGPRPKNPIPKRKDPKRNINRK